MDQQSCDASKEDTYRRYSWVASEYRKTKLQKSESGNSSILPSSVLTHSADQAGPDEASYVSWECPDTPSLKSNNERRAMHQQASSCLNVEEGTRTIKLGDEATSRMEIISKEVGVVTKETETFQRETRPSQRPNDPTQQNLVLHLLGLAPLHSHPDWEPLKAFEDTSAAKPTGASLKAPSIGSSFSGRGHFGLPTGQRTGKQPVAMVGPSSSCEHDHFLPRPINVAPVRGLVRIPISCEDDEFYPPDFSSNSSYSLKDHKDTEKRTESSFCLSVLRERRWALLLLVTGLLFFGVASVIIILKEREAFWALFTRT